MKMENILFKSFSARISSSYNLKISENVKEEENKSEKASDIQSGKPANCLICFDNQTDSVFMNCGHGGIFI